MAGIVLHDEHTDWATIDHGAGHDHAGVADQHIDWVTVLRQRVRHESVVPRVPHRRVQEPIDEERAGDLSSSYLIGSPPTGTSMMTLMSFGGLIPIGI